MGVLDWSPDAGVILYRVVGERTGRDIWALPLPDGAPFPIVEAPAQQTGARFSPDRQWIVYESTDTGRTEVVVRSLKTPGRSTTISTEGGLNPVWRGDGREIFYLAPDDRVMSVTIALGPGDTIKAGTPSPLFSLRPNWIFDVTKDGQRFLVNTVAADAATPPITIVLNWKPRS